MARLGTTTETNAIVGFVAKCVTFGNKVDAIAGLIRRQAEAGLGKRAERDRVFVEMEDSAMELAGVVLSYADEKGMIDLATTVRVVPFDFRGRLGERVRLAQRILTAAESVSEGLAALGIMAAGLADVPAKIDQA